MAHSVQEEDLLSIRNEFYGHGMIVHAHGQIDHATADLLTHGVMNAARDFPQPHVVLDLSQVTFCDSSGLGAFVTLWKALRARRGILVLADPRPLCRLILRRTGIDRYVTVASTLTQAVDQAPSGA